MSQAAPVEPAETVRTLLRVVRAPATLGTTVTLIAEMGGGSKLTLAYMPDRDILTRDSFAAYAAALGSREQVPEALVAAIAADIANELIPKWYQVSIMTILDRVTHHVTVEDRQPGWTDPLPAGKG